MSRFLILLCALLLLAACSKIGQGIAVLTHEPSPEASRAPDGIYIPDPDHISVHFSVRHLGFSDFVARFDDVDARLEFHPEAPQTSTVSVTIKADSINTGSPDIDAVLRDELFMTTEQPDIRYVTETIDISGPSQGTLTGTLHMGGKQHPLTLQTQFNGAAKNPLTGRHTLGFSATATLDRSDWGLGKWYPAVANEVSLRIEAEFVLED